MIRNAGLPVGMAMLAFIALLGSILAVLALSEAPSGSVGHPPTGTPSPLPTSSPVSPPSPTPEASASIRSG